MQTIEQIPLLEDLRDDPHICLAEGLRAATRAVTKIYADRVCRTRLGVSQISTLMRLYYLRSATMSELAASLETDRTTITRNVEVLHRKGFVAIKAGGDRRSRLVSMTGTGRDALVEALPYWQEAQAALRTLLGEATWDMLLGQTRLLAELGAEPSPSAGLSQKG